MAKTTIVINYSSLGNGGIEVNLVQLVRYCLKNEYRVIWLTTNNRVDECPYKEISNNSKVEKILFTRRNLLFRPSITFEKDEMIVMLSFSVNQFIYGEGIRRKSPGLDFRHYFVIAHTNGREYYPEQYFRNSLIKKMMFRYWKRLLIKMNDNNAVIAFVKDHWDKYEKYYGVNFNCHRLFPTFFYPIEFDYYNTMNRARERKNTFTISTCARIDFPHKGYLLGLVDIFARLKESYPNIILNIIGDGADMEKLINKIREQDTVTQNSIVLYGGLPRERLYEIYKKSNLIVGVAGGVCDGAHCGIPSLVMRHYSFSCETYGFFENAIDHLTDSCPGEDAESYINYSIIMPDEEYLDHAKKGYDAIDRFFGEYHPEEVFNWKSNNKTTLSLPERIIGSFFYIVTQFV